MAQPLLHHQSSILRKVASERHCRWDYRGHALKEMRKDGISRSDVRRICQTGAVVRCEMNKFEETYNVEGNDLDGRRITAVVVVYEGAIEIKVITAWKG